MGDTGQNWGEEAQHGIQQKKENRHEQRNLELRRNYDNNENWRVWYCMREMPTDVAPSMSKWRTGVRSKSKYIL